MRMGPISSVSCKTHFEQMRACKNRLSLALMLQSHLQDMQKHIFTRKKMFEGKTAKQKKVSAVNNELFCMQQGGLGNVKDTRYAV